MPIEQRVYNWDPARRTEQRVVAVLMDEDCKQTNHCTRQGGSTPSTWSVEHALATELTCFKCGQAGHIKRNCPDKSGTSTSTPTSTADGSKSASKDAKRRQTKGELKSKLAKAEARLAELERGAEALVGEEVTEIPINLCL